MTERPAAPYVISGLLALGALGGVALVLFDPDPFALGAAVLVTLGLLAYALIAIAGILLVRAPWARWLGLATAVATLLLLAITGFDAPATLVAAGLLLAAVGGLAGPWLEVWLRRRPALGPETKAVALPLVALGAAPLAGLASYSGLTPPVVFAAVLGPIGAWGYAQAWRWGLWILRVAFPIAAVAAATQVDLIGSIVLIGLGLAVGLLAWSTEASRAQRPIGAALPPPRYRRRNP